MSALMQLSAGLAFLASHGKAFKPGPKRTLKIEGTDALRLAQQRPRYTYCEGLADGRLSAWVLDGDGNVFCPAASTYFGVKFKPQETQRRLFLSDKFLGFVPDPVTFLLGRMV